MALVDLAGAYDLHVHASPELFDRLGDELELARHAVQCGLAGIMVKNHFESTVGRAALADRLVEHTRGMGLFLLFLSKEFSRGGWAKPILFSVLGVAAATWFFLIVLGVQLPLGHF